MNIPRFSFRWTSFATNTILGRKIDRDILIGLNELNNGGEIGNCFKGSSGFRHGYPCTGCQGAHGSTRAAYFAIPWRPFLQRQIVLPQPPLPCFLPSPKARKTGPEEQKDGRECWISNSPWSKRERERLIPFCERQEEEILRLDVETQKFLLNEFYSESGCCLGRIRKFCRMPV